jgi:hypothetical protein
LDRITLQPPDYTLELECTGGPWKFRLSGEPNFNPAPRSRPGSWWDCPNHLRAQFGYSKQAAELTIAPAEDGTVISNQKVLRLEFADTVKEAQKVPVEAGSRWTALAALIALLAALVALALVWKVRSTIRTADKQAVAKEKDWNRRLEELANHLERVPANLDARPSVLPTTRTEEPAPSKPPAAHQVSSEMRSPEIYIDEAKKPALPPAILSTPESRQFVDQTEALWSNVMMWHRRVSRRGAGPPEQLVEKIQEYRTLMDSLTVGNTDATLLPAALSEKWSDLAFSIATVLSDHTDQYLDPQREDSEWQTLLRRIFETASAEEIHPHRNDSINEWEHAVVGALESQSPQDLPHHVALLRHRGFRVRGQVLRKAAVVVYH